MSKVKRGLGKGLGALFEDSALEGEEGIINLKISEIEPNKEQPRMDFDEKSLSELSMSIAEHGVLSPLLVRPMPTGQYQLVAGERRWRAARIAGIKEVPVIIKSLTNSQSAEIALIENIQREDLNPIEEAFGYRALMEEFSMTQEDVAKRISKSRSAVANSVRLLNLPENILESIRIKEISTGHGKVLLGLDMDRQAELAKEIILKKLSVRETEKLAKTLKIHEHNIEKQSNKEKKAFLKDPYFSEVEISMNEQLGHKVVVSEKKGIGRLEIHFNNRGELEDIIEKILKVL